ncbi:MAG: LPS export ABC transporter permease LptG [Deltaproteobacteria bacterium]|jgi:lipopolysaccharide export system permease protein|nr:LPS export ABC transporter permease LptG [Deltaproteobacteria bacterium]
MKLIDLYIGSQFLRGLVLISLILLTLFSFFELVNQLDDVGKGSYQIVDAFIFVGYTLPRRLLDLLPISTLLAGIIALGLLADHGELLAMQAGGVSVQRICLSVLGTGMFLIISAGVLAELVIPPLEQQARSLRSRALSATGVTVTKQGLWARSGTSYINVGKTLVGGRATDIDIFESDGQGRLRVYTHAREATIEADNNWVLNDITRKTFGPGGIEEQKLPVLTLDSFLSSDQVNILELPPDSLSSADLSQYIAALRRSGQNADRYALALWRKLSVPLTTGAMVLLSLPFIFGSTRKISAGRRIMLGSLVAIVFYFADQVIVHLGLLLSLNPIITAMIPVVLISSIAFWKLRRTII